MAGLSIEDSTGRPGGSLFDFGLAVERVRAARRAIDRTGSGVLLTARSEGFIVGRPDLAETVSGRGLCRGWRRLPLRTGVAPGGRHRGGRERGGAKARERTVGAGFITVPELAALGVRRVSVGGALARTAWTGFMEAAREIAEHGTFRHLGEATSFADVNGWFTKREQ